MTTLLPAQDAGGRPAGADPLTAPADRGRLTITDRVVERIAAQAATEVDLATGGPRRMLGVPVGAHADRPQVSARVDWPIATVQVVLSVAWPAPVREIAGRVQQQITGRLAELAGVRAASVDVRVTGLTAAPAEQPRVT